MTIDSLCRNMFLLTAAVACGGALGAAKESLETGELVERPELLVEFNEITELMKFEEYVYLLRYTLLY